MHLSVINRVRFTAWAWLASAFLLGLAVGGVGVAVPLWNRLQTALDETARLQQVSNLVAQVDPGSDVQALASLEKPADPAPSPVPALRSEAPSSPVTARAEAAPPAPAAEPAPSPSAPPVAQQASEKSPTPEAAQKAEAASKAAKAAEVLKAARAAEEAERKAKAERQAKAEREQKAAKAAQEALERKEREQAEALAAAARPKAADQPVRKDTAGPVQIAAPVPVGGAGLNAPTERVTKDEAGLTEVQASGVTFKSGRRVAVGDTFPSGEKLVSVNPVIGEIITSKRRIVLKVPATTTQ